MGSTPQAAWHLKTTLVLGLLLLAACSSSPGPDPADPPRSVALNAQGVDELRRGEAEGARLLFEEALREATLVDDRPGRAAALSNLAASIGLGRGSPAAAAEAAALLAEAAALFDAAGDPAAAARARVRRAPLLGDAEAEAALLAAEPVLAAAGDEAGLARLDLAAAALAVRRGDPTAALRRLRGRPSPTDPPAFAAAVHANRGAALASVGRRAEAETAYAAALALDRARGQPQAVAADLLALARLAEAGGRTGEAADLRQRAAAALAALSAP